MGRAIITPSFLSSSEKEETPEIFKDLLQQLDAAAAADKKSADKPARDAGQEPSPL